MSRNLTVLLSVLILTVGLNYRAAHSIISGASPEKSQFTKKQRKEIDRRAKKRAKKYVNNKLLPIDTDEIENEAVTTAKIAGATCPPGTMAGAGLCYDGVNRMNAKWRDAMNDCADEGASLPTMGQLWRVSDKLTVGDELWTDSLHWDNSINGYRAVAYIPTDGWIAVQTKNDTRPYRCVRLLLR